MIINPNCAGRGLTGYYREKVQLAGPKRDSTLGPLALLRVPRAEQSVKMLPNVIKYSTKVKNVKKKLEPNINITRLPLSLQAAQQCSSI